MLAVTVRTPDARLVYYAPIGSRSKTPLGELGVLADHAGYRVRDDYPGTLHAHRKSALGLSAGPVPSRAGKHPRPAYSFWSTTLSREAGRPGGQLSCSGSITSGALTGRTARTGNCAARSAPREPRPRTSWPDRLEWKPNRVWAV